MKLKKAMDKLMSVVINLGIATTFAYITAKILVPIAYAQRGYEAFGGEWLIIIGVFIGTLYLTSDKKKSPCGTVIPAERRESIIKKSN